MTYKRNALAVAVHNGVATMAVAGKLAEATQRTVELMASPTGRAPVARNPPFQPYPRTDPEAAPMSGEAMVQYAPRKRIRVRSKPLMEADIVEGGVYVPKRGNDKTPNFVVVDIDRCEPEYGVLVIYFDGKGDDVSSANLADFLKLVARRVE